VSFRKQGSYRVMHPIPATTTSTGRKVVDTVVAVDDLRFRKYFNSISGSCEEPDTYNDVDGVAASGELDTPDGPELPTCALRLNARVVFACSVHTIPPMTCATKRSSYKNPRAQY